MGGAVCRNVSPWLFHGGGGQSAYPQKAPLTSLQPLSGRKQEHFCSELLSPVLASSQEQTGRHTCVLFLAHTLCLGATAPDRAAMGKVSTPDNGASFLPLLCQGSRR